MKRVGLVRTLKGTILFPAAMTAFFYIVVFPQRILLLEDPGRLNYDASWQICTEIGRDNSFCHKNASRLSGIGFCALVDTGYCAVGTVTLEILVGSPIWVTGLMVCTVGLAIALAAFLLSHLVLKAADMKSENDLTI